MWYMSLLNTVFLISLIFDTILYSLIEGFVSDISLLNS